MTSHVCYDESLGMRLERVKNETIVLRVPDRLQIFPPVQHHRYRVVASLPTQSNRVMQNDSSLDYTRWLSDDLSLIQSCCADPIQI